MIYTPPRVIFVIPYLVLNLVIQCSYTIVEEATESCGGRGGGNLPKTEVISIAKIEFLF